jgi:magnesium-transporting ATPase (P-type)
MFIFVLACKISNRNHLSLYDLGTETLPALAPGVEEPEPGVMDVPPRSKKQGVVDKLLLFRGYVFLGLLNTAAVLAAYFYVLYQGGWSFGMQLEAHETEFINSLHLKATTMVFFGIVVMQIVNVFPAAVKDALPLRLGFSTIS